MFQENAVGIQLYECKSLNARITVDQCNRNKRRADQLRVVNELGPYRHCIKCSGVAGQWAGKKSKHEGMRKCAGCRCFKPLDQFGRNLRTGNLKAKCNKCEANQKKNNHKRRKGPAPAPPPRLNLSSSEASAINGSAIKAFGLEDYDFYCVYWSRNMLFLHAAQEKLPGYYGFRKNSGSQAKKCSARAIRRAIGVDGEARYLIHATDDPVTFRLKEENPAT